MEDDMAYSGYLIRFLDFSDPIPNKYIDRSSWSITPIGRRVVESFFDVDGRYHEYQADHKRTKIQFKLREHSEAEHSVLMQYFQTLDKVYTRYFNDLTESYSFGWFKIDDPVFRHKKTFDSTIWYEETQITMTEY